jgi:hypothetical protein
MRIQDGSPTWTDDFLLTLSTKNRFLFHVYGGSFKKEKEEEREEKKEKKKERGKRGKGREKEKRGKKKVTIFLDYCIQF